MDPMPSQLTSLMYLTILHNVQAVPAFLECAPTCDRCIPGTRWSKKVRCPPLVFNAIRLNNDAT